MSKRVKDLITKDFASRLTGVDDALVVNVIGLNAQKTYQLRRRLREKNITLMVVRNGLVRRATEGTSLAPAMNKMDGSLAFVWGAEDFVSLAKEIVSVSEAKEFEGFETKGGVMDGEQLSADRVKEISKWPSRQEQLSILLGQILSPGANLVAALMGPGASLASQIKQKAEPEDEPAAESGSEAAEAKGDE